MEKWIPDRKWLSGGVAGILAFVVVRLLGLDDESALRVGTGAAALLAYVVPPSLRDLHRRTDAFLRSRP